VSDPGAYSPSQADRVNEARRAEPKSASEHFALANLLRDQGAIDAAMAEYRRTLVGDPDHVAALNNLANLLSGQGKLEEALQHYRRAVQLRPGSAEIHYNFGNALMRRGRLDEAAIHYIRAASLKPDLADAHYSLANVFARHGHLENAIAACRQAVAIRPDFPEAFAQLAMLKMQTCDWQDAQATAERMLVLTRQSPGSIPPADLLCFDVSASDQLYAARAWAKKLEERSAARYRHEPRTRSGKLRLGYLSADLYMHPLAHLVVDMFEHHDRAAFEVTAYSFGRDDGSAMRRRLEAAFDRFVDIRDIDDDQVTKKIYADGIDVMVDLTGYAESARTGILVPRPAPVQVNGIGYTGTMGADFIDYIVADAFVTPMDQQAFFTERLVHLPHCYQPSDGKRETAAQIRTRAECGLPDNGFVFCCFNNRYKFTPRFFDVWMRLLSAVPKSVLWLLETRDSVKDNLRREAERRGVASERLVFAPPVPLAEFLASMHLADLFLDTLPYNAHTTANDALWAGLPVLTCPGSTFAGRVAGSLLQAIGLPDLIAPTLEEYERLALRLAREPALLAGIRQKLARNNALEPLFDIAAYTRAIEAAYRQMWERWCRGIAPEPFAVEAASRR
jgi:predicted O-linked N-acetylglucosamine transferase (SPINDLY family)